MTAYNDLNTNGLRDSGEGLLPGIMITVFADQQALGTYTTDGASEPYCFSGLADGAYQVAQQVGGSWQPTTLAAWGVSLKAGDVYDVEFGNVAVLDAEQSAPADAAADTTTAGADTTAGQSTWERVRTPLFTGVGIFGLMLVVGAVVFIALSRRRI